MRHKLIGSLIAVAFVIGAVGVAPAMAAEEPFESEAAGELITRPVAPNELGSATNGGASPAINCSVGQVCAWAGAGATGQESIWAASETGCHNHSGNTPLRSGYNGTNHNERVGGYGEVPKYSYWESSGPVYGELCW